MDAIAPYYKAVTAVVVPFLSLVAAALLSGSDGGSSITGNEWLSAVVVALLAGGAVFQVDNKDPKGTHQEESVQPPDALDAPQFPHQTDEQIAMGLSRLDAEDGLGTPHRDGGAVDTGWLVAGAALIIIIVGIVWLVQNF